MIDVQNVQDFEQGFAAMLDALDKLRAVRPPTEADGIRGLIKWADEIEKALSLMPKLPDAALLLQFAEEVERAVAGLEEKADGGGPQEKRHPRDDGILALIREYLYGEIVTDAGSGAYTFKEKVRNSATTWADLAGGRTGTCYESNDVAGIAVGTIIKIRVEYDTGGTLRYVFDFSGSAGEVEGGTVPSAAIPAKDKGWIYKYTRDGVEEDAHADPRNETVYKPRGSTCTAFAAYDARGHCIGWWSFIGEDILWESPWGFGDPGLP